MPNNNKVVAIQTLLGFILTKNSDNEYISFSNADNKCWILPKRNTKTALNLYQPSGIKGKLLKFFLPYFKNNKIVQKFLNISTDTYCLEDRLLDLLQGIFETKNIEFAIFGGTPSKHQKITLQLYKGNKILGYCKVSNNREVKNIFAHEQQVLTQLSALGVSQIPECLYCGNLKDDLDVFVQSTIKTNNSKICHTWKNEHWNFLTTLKKKSEKSLLFVESDYFQTLQLLKNNSSYLSHSDTQIITNAILKVVNTFQNKDVCFSAYHSDFTPWNMFAEKGELFVFDFEYAKMTYPPYLDYFHFFTQTGIFEKRWNAAKIYKEHCKQRTTIEKYVDNADFYYLCYLLDIVSLYINRDKGQYSKDVAHNLTIWIALIARL